jgi:hypothetical protein
MDPQETAGHHDMDSRVACCTFVASINHVNSFDSASDVENLSQRQQILITL